MTPPELRALRRLARELKLPAGALDTAVECGVLTPEQHPLEQWQALRQMRRLIDDLGVNAPAAALLVRMARDMQQMQREVVRLRRLEAHYFAVWDEGEWRELEEPQ